MAFIKQEERVVALEDMEQQLQRMRDEQVSVDSSDEGKVVMLAEFLYRYSQTDTVFQALHSWEIP